HALGAEGPGARRFVNDQATAGLLDRLLDRLDVDRNEGAEVEDFGVDAALFDSGQRDMDHGAVGKDGWLRAFTNDRGLADRHGVVPPRHLASRVLRPRLYRPV